MNEKRKGFILVVSGPSGAGKSTLLRRLHEEFPSLTFSISVTTRAKREHETNGKDYFFVSKDEFLHLRDTNSLAEWACVHGNLYGTPKKVMEDKINLGQDILFDIDVKGAKQLREHGYKGIYAFIFPPGRADLERRLKKRGTEDQESFAQRIKIASEEIKQADIFDFWIVNNNIDEAYAELKSIYLAETLRASNRSKLKEAILKSFQ